MPDLPAPAPRYALAFHDEFEGASLDLDKWLPWHLPQWSSRERAAARAQLRDGCLVLEIAPDQRPWCPEFDGEVRVSSLQTGVSSGPVGSTAGQHRFNPAAVVREAQPPRFTFAPRHGWIETRARLDAASPCHAALWLIGIEDEPAHSGEICICELFAEDAGEAASVVRFGVHPFGDPQLVDDFRAARLGVDTREFHVYAAEWTPECVRFFVDGAEIGTVAQSPRYPMQLMLGLYERTRGPVGVRAQRFVVDWVRAWQTAS